MTMPLGAAMGSLPQNWWTARLQEAQSVAEDQRQRLEKDVSFVGLDDDTHNATVQQSTETAGPHIQRVKECLYIAFTLPAQSGNGRYEREPSPIVHFGMLDSGAQISCVARALLDSFPALK